MLRYPYNFVLAGLALLLVIVPALQAQRGASNGPELDPYTKGERKALDKAGYERLDRFAFGGNGGGTSAIREVLGDLPIRWVETAHFKIGSTLPEARAPGTKAARKQLEAELKRLKKRIPKVNPRTKVLDPWLRLHLYAQRMEELYERMSTLLGVDADSFAEVASTREDVKFMGFGPYLGMKEKFGLLLFEKGSSVARYFQTYTGQGREISWRHYYKDVGGTVFATAEEWCDDEADIAISMHGDVLSGMSQCLFDGFKGFEHMQPMWMSIGLARWHQRQIDPKRLRLSNVKGFNMNDDDNWKWEQRLHVRAKTDYFPKLEEMLEKSDYRDMTFIDHMLAWSRIDFLMQDPEKFAEYIDRIKGRMDWSRKPHEVLQERQLSALKEVYGYSPADFDAAWKKYVLKNYPAK